MSVSIIGICYFGYGYLFNFGPFKKDFKVPSHPQSIAEIGEGLSKDAKDDLDSFTKGTLSLAKAVSERFSGTKDSLTETVTRTKRMVSSQENTEPKEQNNAKLKQNTANET